MLISSNYLFPGFPGLSKGSVQTFMLPGCMFSCFIPASSRISLDILFHFSGYKYGLIIIGYIVTPMAPTIAPIKPANLQPFNTVLPIFTAKLLLLAFLLCNSFCLISPILVKRRFPNINKCYNTSAHCQAKLPTWNTFRFL